MIKKVKETIVNILTIFIVGLAQVTALLVKFWHQYALNFLHLFVSVVAIIGCTVLISKIGVELLYSMLIATLVWIIIFSKVAK